MQTDRRGTTRARLCTETDTFNADFSAGAPQAVGRRDFQTVGEEGDAFLITEETALHRLVAPVALGLRMCQDIQTEVAIIVAAIRPVHMEQSVGIQSVQNEGMTATAHDAARVIDRTASGDFGSEIVPERGRRIEVTVQIVYVSITKSAPQRFNEAEGVGTAGGRSPVHVARHAEHERQTGDSVNGFLRSGTLFVVVIQNEARIDRRAGQDVRHGVVFRFPTFQCVAQNNGGAMVGQNLLHGGGDAADKRRIGLSRGGDVGGTGAIVGRALVTHGGEQRRNGSPRLRTAGRIVSLESSGQRGGGTTQHGCQRGRHRG